MIVTMYKSSTKIKVRYAETDKMGIVYHSNYYIYFEVAREDLISYAGMKYKALEDYGVMMPIMETHCKYHEGARYGDELDIETYIEELTPFKAVIGYKVMRESDNKLIAQGKTVQAFVDSQSFRIINLKKVHPDIWEKLNVLV